jgi:hypothetical protein
MIAAFMKAAHQYTYHEQRERQRLNKIRSGCMLRCCVMPMIIINLCTYERRSSTVSVLLVCACCCWGDADAGSSPK